MSELVFGEVDWNSADSAAPGGNRVEFMRLSEGANVVRVLSNPLQFYVNWVTLPDGRKRKINSPDSTELVRKLEDGGFKRQTRWIVKVLDRKDNQFKLLEIGSQIFNSIKSLYNNPKWGKVNAYDVTINRGPKGTQPLYSVQPDPKEPLDASLRDSFQQFNDTLNLERLLSPSDPKYVCELLGWPVPGGAAPGVTDSDEADPFDGSASESGGFDYDFS